MKSYFWKFVLCIVPVVWATWVTYDAAVYGKFKKGVDLSGGHILVYEMDLRKLEEKRQDEKTKSGKEEQALDFYKSKAGELASALKRRIDPTATFNIIIRPAGTEGRVEIIIPTGDPGKVRDAEIAWSKLVKNLEKEWGVKDLNVARGRIEELVDQIQQKKARAIWETSLLNEEASWIRLLNKLRYNEDKKTGFAALENKDPDTKKTYIQMLEELKAGELEKLKSILVVALDEQTPQKLDNDIRQFAWDELIFRLVRWDELKKTVEAEVKKESKEELKDAELKKRVEEELKILESDLKNVPADSFHELVGRVQTYGDVVSQSALDTLEVLMGKVTPSGMMDQAKIEAFITQNYGPSPRVIEASINSLVDAEEMKLIRDPSLEDVQKIKDLVSKTGALEFSIIANGKDDKTAIEDIQRLMNSNDPAIQKKLEDAAINGLPPPVETQPGKPNEPKKYDIKLAKNAKSTVTYSWVELGKQERRLLGFSNDSRTDSRVWRQKNWLFMQANHNKAVQVPDPRDAKGQKKLWEGALFYRREAKDRNAPEKERRDKKYEYWVLRRNPEFNPTTGAQEPAITGKYLRTAGVDNSSGRAAVSFSFTPEGGELFGTLTGKNVPDEGGTEESSFKRHLAIILDGLVMSAPTINSKITTNGQITGDFTRKEVDSLVNILRSGALPATLKPQPVSETTIGPLLGADTIYSGMIAIFWSFIAVIVFIMIYYQFAGLVACVALFANLVLTVGFMVAVQATFTLPGLAGLVLMLGMAVDANVLIYERLREERDRGASLALALRNAYDRALPVIIDTHLTTLFTGVVLYAVGTDQLKGFSISLIVGLLISLFTSLYMTHVIFSFWLERGWLKKLNMFRLLTQPHLNFMGVRHYVFAGTVILSVAGLALFLARTPTNLDIDFKGGTAFSAQLEKGQYKTITQLRELLTKTRQEQMLTVHSVTQTDETGNEFKIVFKEPGGKLSPEYEIVLANVPKGRGKDFKEANEADVRKRLSELPDWGVEQIFLSQELATAEAPTVGGEYASKRFTVRTSERERGIVELMLVRLFREEKSGQWVSLLNLNNLDEVDTSKLASKSTVKLIFEEPASTSFLSNTLSRQLRQEFGTDEVTLQPKVRFEIVGIGQSVEGQYKEMQVTFNPPLKGNQVEKVKGILVDKDGQKSPLHVAFELPQPDRLENFDSELAADTRMRAVIAIFVSWLAIVLYLWFRFGSWTFGTAAVLCLIHNLCLTLGLVALSAYIAPTFFGQWLLIQDFKLDLNAVAALLTLTGYSVNDTIVVFDRIREVRGKNPELTPKIINDSLNQTLSRTVLTGGSVLMVVLVLYISGGPGLHLFSFIMVVGVLIGTFGSVYFASPLLLLLGEGQKVEVRHRRPQAVEAPA